MSLSHILSVICGTVSTKPPCPPTTFGRGMAALLAGLAMLGVGGCSLTPTAIDVAADTEAPNEIPIDQVEGLYARWGGVVAEVENRPDNTLVEVIGKPLGFGSRPNETEEISGRFLARLEGFIDPASIPTQREITVVGPVVNTVTRSIGEYQYEYPVVAADAYYLWDERLDRDYHYTYHRYPYAFPYGHPFFYPGFYYRLP